MSAPLSNEQYKIRGKHYNPIASATKTSDKGVPAPKDQIVAIRVSKEEKDFLKSIAKFKGCTVSKYIMDSLYANVQRL